MGILGGEEGGEELVMGLETMLALQSMVQSLGSGV